MIRAQRVQTSTLLVTVAITIGSTFAVLIAPGSGSFELLSTRVIYDTATSAALIAWLAFAVVRPEWRPASRLFPAIVVALSAYAISTATSRIPRLSAEMLGYAVLLAGLYLLTVTLMRQPRLRRHFEQLAVLFTVIVCALYLLQVTVAWIGWWDLIGGPAIPPLRPTYLGLRFGSPNPVATLVFMLGAFGLATSHLERRASRICAAGLVAVVGMVVLITGSRGAWLGGAVAIAVVVAAALAIRPEVRDRAKSVLRSPAGVLGALILTPLIVAAIGLATLSGRLSLEGGGTRAGFTNASLAMFESSPVSGVGPGTWGVLRAMNTDESAPDLYLPHAHNLYVQIAAEFGIGGIAAGVLLLVVLGALVFGAIRSGESRRRRVAFGALFAIVLFAIQQLVDVLASVPAVLFAVGLPVAWVDAASLPAPQTPSEPGRSDQGRATTAALFLGIATVVVVWFGLARIESAAATSDTAVSYADRGAWSDAARLFDEVATIDPGLPMYRFASGLAAANSGDFVGALTDLEAAAAADHYSYAWMNLAAVRWKIGDIDGARAALQRAERLGLQRAPIAVAAGWLRWQLGDEQASVDAFASALAISPMLATDPFWSSPDGPPGGLEAVLTVIEGRADVRTLLQISLLTGRLKDAATYVEKLEGEDPDLYRLLIPASAGDPEAWIGLQALAAERNQNAYRISWAIFVAVIRRDVDEDQRYRDWLAVVFGPDGNLPMFNRIEFGSAQPQPSYLQDRYESVYRRPLPVARLVSILPQTIAVEGVDREP